MGIPLPKGNIQTLMFRSQDRSVLHMLAVLGSSGEQLLNMCAHRINHRAPVPLIVTRMYITSLKTTTLTIRTLPWDLIKCWKNLSFYASATAWIWKGRKDRKELIMREWRWGGNEEICQKRFHRKDISWTKTYKMSV